MKIQNHANRQVRKNAGLKIINDHHRHIASERRKKEKPLWSLRILTCMSKMKKVKFFIPDFASMVVSSTPK